MQKLLDGDNAIFSILREQLEAIIVTKREMTGVGFYTTFAVSQGARRVPGNRSFKFGDVTAELPGLKFGAGFLLYVKDGALHMLEGYSYDEKWPQETSDFALSYTKGLRRDPEVLQKILSD
jgi:hypothetical protein